MNYRVGDRVEFSHDIIIIYPELRNIIGVVTEIMTSKENGEVVAARINLRDCDIANYYAIQDILWTSLEIQPYGYYYDT